MTEIISIPLNSPSVRTTTLVTDPLKLYRVRFYGVGDCQTESGANGLHDALYWYEGGKYRFGRTPSSIGQQVYLEWNGRVPPYRPYHPGHQYFYPYVRGTGTTWRFQFFDPQYTNNSGTLYVEIKELNLAAPNHEGCGAACPVTYVSSSVCSGSPISLLDGDKTETVTDLRLTTPAGELSFTRSYRQSKLTEYLYRDQQQEPVDLLGAGWLHNHAAWIDASVSGKLLVWMEGSTRVHFTYSGSGSVYVGDAGSTASIDAGGSGLSRYTLTAQDGSVYVFDEVGRIRSRTWANHEGWTYRYYGDDAGDPAYAAGLLKSVDDGYERQLRLTYIDAAGQYSHRQLWRVGDHTSAGLTTSSPTGRYVEFAYTQSRLNGVITTPQRPLLSAVRDVQGRTWTYVRYGQASGERDSRIHNWLLRYLTPPVDSNGDGVADGLVTVKELAYTLAGSVPAAIQQRLGKVGSAAFLAITDYRFRADGSSVTTETTGGKTRTHLFAGEVYVGTEDGLSHADYVEFNEAYRPELQLDANGSASQLEWSSDGKRLNGVTDALNNSTSFAYNANETLKSSTDAAGVVTEYTYGDPVVGRQPTRITTRKGAVILRWQELTYDSKGRTLTEKLVDPADGSTVLQQTTRSYYTSGEGHGLLQEMRQQDMRPGGNDTITTYSYDSAGRVKKTQHSSSFGSCQIRFTVYDPDGNVTASLCNFDGAEPTTPAEAVALFDPAVPDRNVVTTYDYDAMGRRWKTTRYYTDDGIHVRQRSDVTLYDALGRVRRSITRYTAQGSSAPGDWVFEDGVWKQEAGGTAIAFGPQQTGNIVSDTAYNARGLVRMQRDVEGKVTLYGYDDADRLVKTVQHASDPDYHNDYPAGDPTLGAYPAAASADRDVITTQGYDAAGNLVQSTDARGISSFTVYDALNRPVRTIQSARPSASMALNPGDANYVAADDPRSSDYQLSADPARDRVTETGYDPLGRITSTRRLLENRGVAPVWDETRYVYDGLGRQRLVIMHYRAQGASDPANWVWSDANQRWEDGANSAIAFQSDAGVANEDVNVITETIYDSAERVQSTRDVYGRLTRYVYDGLGRRVRTIVNYVEQGGTDPGDWVYEDGVWKRGAGGLAVEHRSNLALDNEDQNLITETVYDDSGRALETRDPAGNLSHTVYDDAHHGRVKTRVENYVPQGSVADWMWNASALRWEYSPGSPVTRSTTYSDTTPHTITHDLNVISQPAYDMENRVLQQRDARGSVTRFVYDAAGRPVRTIVNYVDQGGTDPGDWVYEDGVWKRGAGSAAVDHGPHSDQNLVSETVYDLSGRVLESRDAQGSLTRYVYDGLGRRRLTIANYVPQGTPEAWVHEGGVWKESPGGPAVVQRSDPAREHYDQNLISQTAYDKAGQVVSTRDARGTLTTFAYDAAGRRTTITTAAGTPLATTSYTCYDKGGRRLRTVQQVRLRAEQSTARFDDWSGGTWAYVPVDHGDGHDENLITTLTYDAASRQRLTVDPAGDQTEIRYFRDGQICAKRDALNVMTLYRYDGLRRNRLVVQNYQAQKDHLDQDVDPVTWRWSNDRWEYLFNAGAAVWNAVAFGTDNDRNVIVQVTYDRVGRVTGRRDPRGSLTSYRYDRLGRRRLLSNPLNQQWLTAFADVIEGSGQIGQTTKRYPLGYAVTHETDRVGRLARVDYGAAASTPAVSFAYDLVGSRVRMDETGATGTVRTTHYAHDRLQRLTQVAFDSDGDGTTDQTVSYAYDAGGLRTTLTLPGEVSITYQYDAAGRLASLTAWDGQVTTFGYDQAGRQTLTARASGLTSRYRHDASGQLREIHHSGPWQVERMLQAYLYALDGRGNRTQAREVRRRATPTAVVTIAHDDGSVVYSGAWAAETAYHVTTSVTAGLGVRLYLSADGQGQATLPIVVGVGPDHGRFDLYLDGTLWETHDGYASVSGERTIDLPVRGVSGEHLLQIRSRADRNPASSGNRLRFRQVSAQRLYDTRTIDYAYDGVSRLIEADYDNGAEILTYGFDVAGNLTNLNGTARTYNAANQLIHDGTNALTYDANGNMTGDGVNSYTWDRANRLLAMGGVSYAYNGDGDRVAQTSGVNVTQYLLDLQPGLALVLGDSDGNRYVHAPRGLHAVDDGAAWTYPLTDGLGSVRGYVDANNVVLSDVDYSPYGVPDTAWTGWAFTGEQRDSNALQYHRARYYAPGLGIFPSLDPFEGIMERPMSLNGYSWVEGNVVNLIDASGKCIQAEICNNIPHWLGWICKWIGLMQESISTLTPHTALFPSTVSVSSGTPCCDNRAIVPSSVAYAPCSGGPPRIISYDKDCDTGSASRDACGVQVYRKLAEQYGHSGCLTWQQVLAMIYRKELGFLKPGYSVLGSTFEPENQQTVWNLAKEAGARLISQRVGNLSDPDVFGFICLLGTIESWYVNSTLGSANNYQSVNVNMVGWEDFLADASDALGQFSNGFQVGRPVTWENIIDPRLGILQSEFGFGPNNLSVANSEQVKARLGRGFYPIAAIPGNAGSPYADGEGYLYITLTYHGGGSTGFSCIG